MERATTSFPVPDSPVINTVTELCERRPIARKISCIDSACPIKAKGSCTTLVPTVLERSALAFRARSITSTAFTTSKGLARYSKAPPLKDATALSTSE